MRVLPLLAAVLVLPVLDPPARAQSVAGIDTDGNLTAWAGVGTSPCFYPGGPLLSQWGYVQGSPCTPIPGPVAGPPSHLGDIARNRGDGTYWVTDGMVIAESDSGGATFNGFPLAPGSVLPGPLTGLGFDYQTYGLWITDGTSAAQIQPPQPLTCDQGPTVLVFAFALPLVPGATATDIEWDPITQSLYVCDDLGLVTNVLSGGALGPNGVVPTGGALCTELGLSLEGLAVDTANPAGAVWVTDGDTIAYIDPATGLAAAPTFYMPTNCQPSPTTGHLMGLAFRGFPLGYGKPSGGPVFPFLPVIGANSEPWAGNSQFAVEVAGQQPFEAVALFASAGALCPALPVLGVDALISFGGLLSLGTVFTGDTPAPVSFPVPVPASFGAGFPVWFQGVAVDTGTFHFSATGGLHLTTSAL